MVSDGDHVYLGEARELAWKEKGLVWCGEEECVGMSKGRLELENGELVGVVLRREIESALFVDSVGVGVLAGIVVWLEMLKD